MLHAGVSAFDVAHRAHAVAGRALDLGLDGSSKGCLIYLPTVITGRVSRTR